MKLALALCLMATPALADPLACAPRSKLAQKLSEGWGETSQAQGLSNDGKSILEFFGRPNGTWTLVVVTPDGKACIIAAGSVWIVTGVPQGEAG